jgi:hypothetical protein
MPDSESEVDEAKAEPEPVPEPKPQRAPKPHRIFKRTLKSQGGVSFIKPQAKTKTPGYWAATYKNYRKTGFATKAAAEAKLKQWKDEDLCSCCEQNWPI